MVMTLRTRIFAATYDRQSAKVEKAGLGAHSRTAARRRDGQSAGSRRRHRREPAHYGPGSSRLTLTEPEPADARAARASGRATGAGGEGLAGTREDLPFEDDTFDVVVSTLVLCGVNDQPRALREIRRVLQPGGRLLFIEHVRSDDPKWPTSRTA